MIAAPSRHAGEARDESLDALREREFGRLAEHGEAYLDYAGAALYGESQIRAHDELLRSRLFGNPHSEHRPSRAATAAIETARSAVLRLAGASAATHAVVFTANASAAIRLVAESYPFGARRGLLLCADNHNSVNGVREPARRAGAPRAVLPLDAELRLDDPEPRIHRFAAANGGLFAYPAQSNFSGVRHSLELLALARERGLDTLLDAAAFAASAPLDLARHPADFTVLSFYKLFGLPTGVGALVARRDALARLNRPWFAGGTVLYASVAAARHRLREGAERFEDGTPNFLGIAALAAGFELLAEAGLDRIGAHVAALTGELIAGLAELHHPGGAPLVRIHGPVASERRGGTVAFSVLDENGGAIPYELVAARTSAAGVCLRGGCFCNPGAAEAAFGLADPGLGAALDELGARFTPARLSRRLAAPVGALRASVGLATGRDDLRRALDLIASFASPSASAARSRRSSAPARRTARPRRDSRAGTSTSAAVPR